MKKYKLFSDIPNELIGCFIDGKCTKEESDMILSLADHDNIEMLSIAYKANKRRKDRMSSTARSNKETIGQIRPLQPMSQVAYVNTNALNDIFAPLDQKVAFVDNSSTMQNDGEQPKDQEEEDEFTKLLRDFINNTTDQKATPPKGDGTTSTNPYSICTVEDLLELIRNINSGENKERRYYNLENDIDLSECNEWTSIAHRLSSNNLLNEHFNGFNGHFNGNNKSITGLDIYTKRSFQGLFSHIGADGVVCNLTVEGWVKGGSKVGGIAGINYGTIINCTSQVDVAGERMIGGVVGLNYGKIFSSTNCGYVKGDKSVGGIAGCNAMESIVGCNNTGQVRGKCRAGGIIGENYQGSISSSHNDGFVMGDDEVGSVVGRSVRGTITACSNSKILSPNDDNYKQYEIVGYNEDSDIF